MGLSVNVKGELNAIGAAPIYACRAWVNFNGTGTVAILASGNVSSITDDGVGLYTVNFLAAMPDKNYSYGFGFSYPTNSGGCERVMIRQNTHTASACPIAVGGCGGISDFDVVTLQFFR